MTSSTSQQRIGTLKSALQSMWSFASGLVAKHGEDGDATMTDGEHADWQAAAGQANQALGSLPETETVTVYSGYVTLYGNRIQIDFQAASSATKEELDSLFLAELAKKVDLDYLAMGTAEAPIAS